MSLKTATAELIAVNEIRSQTYRDKYGRSVTRYTKWVGQQALEAVVVLLPKTYSEHKGTSKRVYLVNDWQKPRNVEEGDGIFHIENRNEAHAKAVRLLVGL